MSGMDVNHRYVTINGVNLHVVEAGDQNGPLIILLHGFPEYWGGWRRQIPFLAAQGFWVWAPDQRGYNLSDKPRETAAYSLDVLAADVAGLIRASGREKAIVVGHDWGAAAAWWTAVVYPQLLSHLIILNAPHPVVMHQTLRQNWRQLLKSWRIFFFQLPFLPELMIRANHWRAAAGALQRSSRRNAFSAADLDQYRDAWSRPYAITGMLNWYRAILRHPPARRESARVTAPTQIIWGARDAFLTAEMAERSLAWCDNGRLTLIEKATHWVHHEQADQVNQLIVQFSSENHD
jgi:epoxide hydrolase 4